MTGLWADFNWKNNINFTNNAFTSAIHALYWCRYKVV